MGDSQNNADEGAATKAKDGARAYLGAAAGCLAIAGTILTVFVALPFAIIAFAFWAAEGSWNFEGDRNIRYWLFVSGKRAERLGLVAPTEKPVRYSVGLPEGNFPGWTIMTYDSKATPDEVIEAYAKRCETLSGKVSGRPPVNPKENMIAAHLECEFAGYLTAGFYAERASSSELSEVSLRVWGRE